MISDIQLWLFWLRADFWRTLPALLVYLDEAIPFRAAIMLLGCFFLIFRKKQGLLAFSAVYVLGTATTFARPIMYSSYGIDGWVWIRANPDHYLYNPVIALGLFIAYLVWMRDSLSSVDDYPNLDRLEGAHVTGDLTGPWEE